MVDTARESEQIVSDEKSNGNDADIAKENASETPTAIRIKDEESDDESDDEDIEENKTSTSQVKEGMLLDTNIGPEPIVFDPMEVTAKGEVNDNVAEDKLFDLIASLSEDVKTSTE